MRFPSRASAKSFSGIFFSFLHPSFEPIRRTQIAQNPLGRHCGGTAWLRGFLSLQAPPALASTPAGWKRRLRIAALRRRGLQGLTWLRFSPAPPGPRHQ